MSEEENVLRDRRAAWPETRWRGDREASHLLGPRHLHLQNGGLDRVPAGAPPPMRGSLGDDDLHDQTWELREAGAGLGPGSRACRPRDALPGSPSWGPRPGVPVLSAPLRGADGGRRLRQSRRLFGFPVASALSGRGQLTRSGRSPSLPFLFRPGCHWPDGPASQGRAICFTPPTESSQGLISAEPPSPSRTPRDLARHPVSGSPVAWSR